MMQDGEQKRLEAALGRPLNERELELLALSHTRARVDNGELIIDEQERDAFLYEPSFDGGAVRIYAPDVTPEDDDSE